MARWEAGIRLLAAVAVGMLMACSGIAGSATSAAAAAEPSRPIINRYDPSTSTDRGFVGRVHVSKSGCVYLGLKSGHRRNLTWPTRMHAVWGKSGAAVVKNRRGVVVAREGERIEFAGNVGDPGDGVLRCRVNNRPTYIIGSISARG